MSPTRREFPSSCLVVLATLAGCVSAFPSPPMPAGLHPVPAPDIAKWVAVTRPNGHLQLPFSWKFRDADGSEGGRGTARVAAPDSLRLDYRGPFGAGAGAAAVVGESALWTQPPDALQKLVPNYPLLWAMIGVARLPGPGWAVVGRQDPGVTAWRYTRGADTVNYVWSRGVTTILEADVHEGGKPVGRAVTVMAPDGRPVRARLDIQASRARLEIDFDHGIRQPTFKSDVWNAPSDQ